MKLVQIKLLFVLSVLLIQSQNVKGQISSHLASDSLVNSLRQFIEKVEVDSVFRRNHYLLFDEYDYFASINSLELADEIIDKLSRITPHFGQKQLAEITFVRCYDWTEAIDKWFITLIDKEDNHHIYFYETGMNKPDRFGVRKGRDYFYRLANNLFSNMKCGDKNEDYIVTGRIVEGKFTAYFSSQLYHRMDIVFFNDLLEAVSN